MTEIKIIGISLGTRTFGFAVITDRGLIEWGLKEFKGQWSEAKLQKILTAIEYLICTYKPISLAVKLPHPSRTSLALDTLVAEIEKLAALQDIIFQSYSIADIEQECTNKRMLSDALIVKYPILNREYQKVCKTEKSPYEKVFEAVGAIEFLVLNS